MLFDFALDEVEVGTIRTLLHEELRPSQVVAFKTRRRGYVSAGSSIKSKTLRRRAEVRKASWGRREQRGGGETGL